MASILKVDRILDSTELGTVDIPGGISIDGNRVSGIPGYNYIINGNFDIWQRGTSQTVDIYASVDRWKPTSAGSSKTLSRRSFGVGQYEVQGNPVYFTRIVVSSVVGASNYVQLIQKIEGVRTLAGQKATLSFWAKADASKNMAIEFTQTFGTGGSPSANVLGIGSQLISLTTSWKKYAITVDIPSIIGKTLGTAGNDVLQFNFWFDAGTNYNARTDNLGHQSGTFDIACVSLVEGDVDIKPIPRSYGEELALCERYYATGRAYTRSFASGADQFFETPVYFPTRMRAIPVTTIADGGGRGNAKDIVLAAAPTTGSTRHSITSIGVGNCMAIADIWTADAEL